MECGVVDALRDPGGAESGGQGSGCPADGIAPGKMISAPAERGRFRARSKRRREGTPPYGAGRRLFPLSGRLFTISLLAFIILRVYTAITGACAVDRAQKRPGSGRDFL